MASGNLLARNFTLSAGSSIYYYEHSYEKTVFSLFDLSFTEPEDLIKLKTIYGVGADVGMFLNNDSTFFPKLSIQIKNINSKVKDSSEVNQSTVQNTDFLFETYSTVGIGKDVSTRLGGLDFSLEFPFYEYFKQVSLKHSSFSTRYSLGLFSVLIGVGKFYQNIGLRFDSKNFNVGISYARESDMGSLQPSIENSVYTGVDIVL